MAYATASNVANLIRSLANRTTGAPADFDSNSVPTLAEVNSTLDQIAAEIDVGLGSLGFIQPLANTGGSALTTTQSNFLLLLNGIGAAGLVIGSMFPYAAQPTQVGPRPNPFRSRYDSMMHKIEKTGGYGLRMNSYVGTPADKQFVQVHGPADSYSNNKEDVRDYLDLWAMTEITQIAQETEVRTRSIGSIASIDFATLTSGMLHKSGA